MKDRNIDTIMFDLKMLISNNRASIEYLASNIERLEMRLDRLIKENMLLKKGCCND